MSDPIGERVARLEAVLPEIRNDIKQLKYAVLEQLKDHERRLSALERWRYWLLGVAAALGTIITAAWDWIKGGR